MQSVRGIQAVLLTQAKCLDVHHYAIIYGQNLLVEPDTVTEKLVTAWVLV